MNEVLRRVLFLPEQATAMAREIDGLHYLVILTTIGGALLVTVVGGVFLFKYRSLPHAPVRALPTRPAILWAEWGVVAGLLGLFVLFWFVGFRQFLRLRIAPENSLEVYVTAKQWMWMFTDTDGRGSQSVLHVPTHRPVKLFMTSRDVIHSFYVPEFRIKQDVLPGRTTTVWFEAIRPGRYDILCTELCGVAHSTMRGSVVAHDPAEYAAWLEGLGGAETFTPLARMGKLVAVDRGCFRCHTVDGMPHLGPTWAGLFGSTVLLDDGRTVRADEAFMTESMMEPSAKLRAGYAPIMPSYQGRLLPAETAALLEYIKSLPARDRP